MIRLCGGLRVACGPNYGCQPYCGSTDNEKAAIRFGHVAKSSHKDVDARWPVKFTTARANSDGTKQVDIALPHLW